MARHVLKFAGCFTADPQRLYATARKLATEHQAGHEVIGLLSAPESYQDALLARARQIDPSCHGQELEVLLSAAGSCAASLCALALQRMGFPAVSLNRWQTGLLNDDSSLGGIPLENSPIEQKLKQGNIILLSDALEKNTANSSSPREENSVLSFAALFKADRCYIYPKCGCTLSEGAIFLPTDMAELAKKYGVFTEVRPFAEESL